MTEQRSLQKYISYGDIVEAYVCSQCGREFPVPGGPLNEEGKMLRVRTAFNQHNCNEDLIPVDDSTDVK